MSCCEAMVQGLNEGVVVYLDRPVLVDGRLMNEVESEYHLRIGRNDGSYSYYAIAFCPFCGRPISAKAQGLRG